MLDIEELISKWRGGTITFEELFALMDALITDHGVVKDYETIFSRLRTWAEAYPLDQFPEPDFKEARRALNRYEMNLGDITASAQRHLLTSVIDIINDAEVGENK